MKSQMLPITTVILIVLAMLVLATVILFFFMGMEGTPETVTEQQAISRCGTKCSRIIAARPLDEAGVKRFAITHDYCASINVRGATRQCPDLTTCYIEYLDCYVECDDSEPSCVVYE